MPIARRDRYEWEYVLSAIEIASDDPENHLGLRRVGLEALSALEAKIEATLKEHPHTGEWTRIPVVLTEAERALVNGRLVRLVMVRLSFLLERWDLLGVHAVDEEHAEIQDRVLYITTVSPKSSTDTLSIWIAHPDFEWLRTWMAGCTTPCGELR